MEPINLVNTMIYLDNEAIAGVKSFDLTHSDLYTKCSLSLDTTIAIKLGLVEKLTSFFNYEMGKREKINLRIELEVMSTKNVKQTLLNKDVYVSCLTTSQNVDTVLSEILIYFDVDEAELEVL